MLTALAIEKLKPKEKQYKVSDGNQLSLLVEPAGAKLWRLRYTFCGREKMLSLGSFPQVSLAAARDVEQEQDDQHPQSAIDDAYLFDDPYRLSDCAPQVPQESPAQGAHIQDH